MSRKGRSRKFYQGSSLINDLAECRRIINKILGGEKLTRAEWNFIGRLPFVGGK